MFDHPLSLTGKGANGPTKPDQTQSNRFKPSQTQGLAGVRTNYGRPALRAARPSRSGQSGSNPIKPRQTKSKLLGGSSSASLHRRLRQKVLWVCDFCVLSRLCPRPCGNQGQSNQIKPNQTCGAVGMSRNWTFRRKRPAECSLVNPNQTGSNPVKLRQSEQPPACIRQKPRAKKCPFLGVEEI